MKSWLAKFRISNALDSGQPLPESLRRAIAADPELKRFAHRTEALGQTLRKPPLAEPAMHDSIMRAVRASARREQPRRAPLATWWAATAAVAAVVVICLWTGHRRQVVMRGQSLDRAAKVLEMSEHLPVAMPSYVMAPLSNEWARVDRNLQDTKQVLLASLP